MASFRKRPGKNGVSYLARVRIDDKDLSKTFKTLADAKRWAVKQEADTTAIALGKPTDSTVAGLIMKYILEVLPTKRGERPEGARLQRIAKSDLGAVSLKVLGGDQIKEWSRGRCKLVSSSSARREMVALSSVLTYAVDEWRFLPVNPCRSVTWPAEGPGRYRRPTQDEIGRILIACGYEAEKPLETKTQRVGAAMLFAIETAMRAGEIIGLRQKDIKDLVVRLEKTKNDNRREVPLSVAAEAILKQCGKSDPVFGLTSANLDALWRKITKRCEIEDLHFHDMRREALTRLAKVYPNVMDLAKISGHRSLSILLQTYYAPTSSDLLTKMRAAA